MKKPKRKRPAAPAAAPERVQKVLARIGVGSRREVEQWIRAGRLTVNGQPATLGVKVGAGDEVKLDGRAVRQRAAAGGGTVFVGHRSPGEGLLRGGDEGEAWIERLPRKAGKRFVAISPMPRVDGGLELVSSDGEAATRLQRAAHALSSEFSVRVRGELNEQQLAAILEGSLDRGVRLQVESCQAGGGEGANRWYTLVARGGSGKDVRQLFERQGALVSRVLRVRMGTLTLDRTLARGHFRELTREEIAGLTSADAARRMSGP